MKKTFIINELDCANCAAKMERAISKIKGVEDVTVNFMTKKAVIFADEDAFTNIINEANQKISKIDSEAVLEEV
ncbi:MAG: heavy-metal-associated domain-containing protein [Lachnospiraceae bacterium]|nr:heavy-metal-associated domain-containing protein [Lachnospiraceae bacterium]